MLKAGRPHVKEKLGGDEHISDREVKLLVCEKVEPLTGHLMKITNRNRN